MNKTPLCIFYTFSLSTQICILNLNLLVGSLGSIKCRIMLLSTRECLNSSFPIGIPFISFICLIAWAKNSSTIFNNSGDNDHTHLIPYFRENTFSFSRLSIILAMYLLHRAIIILRDELSSPSFFRAFITKGCWIFVKGFICSC